MQKNRKNKMKCLLGLAFICRFFVLVTRNDKNVYNRKHVHEEKGQIFFAELLHIISPFHIFGWSISFSLSLSLSLSLTHTHTHTLPLSLSPTTLLSFTHSHTHKHPLSLSHTTSLSIFHSLTHSHTLSLSSHFQKFNSTIRQSHGMIRKCWNMKKSVKQSFSRRFQKTFSKNKFFIMNDFVKVFLDIWSWKPSLASRSFIKGTN